VGEEVLDAVAGPNQELGQFDRVGDAAAGRGPVEQDTVGEGESASTTAWCGGYGKLKHQAR
jgi:hypothetical protein